MISPYYKQFIKPDYTPTAITEKEIQKLKAEYYYRNAVSMTKELISVFKKDSDYLRKDDNYELYTATYDKYHRAKNSQKEFLDYTQIQLLHQIFNQGYLNQDPREHKNNNNSVYCPWLYTHLPLSIYKTHDITSNSYQLQIENILLSVCAAPAYKTHTRSKIGLYIQIQNPHRKSKTDPVLWVNKILPKGQAVTTNQLIEAWPQMYMKAQYAWNEEIKTSVLP